MSRAVIQSIGVAGTAISTDSDPNTAVPPDTRRFIIRPHRGGVGQYLYALPKAGTTISLRVWIFDRQMNRWFAVGATKACPTDEVTAIVTSAPGIPSDVEVFIQVTANTNVEIVGIGVYEDG